MVRVGREDGERLRAAARVLGLDSRRGDGVATFMREAAVRAAREVLGGAVPGPGEFGPAETHVWTEEEFARNAERLRRLGPPAAEEGNVRSGASGGVGTMPAAGAGGSSRAGGVAVPPAAAPSLQNAKVVVAAGGARAVPQALGLLEAGRVRLGDGGEVFVDGKRRS